MRMRMIIVIAIVTKNTQTIEPGLHKMLLPIADVERLYILRKDGGRGLIEAEAAFKTATIGLDHYLKHKEVISKAGA